MPERGGEFPKCIVLNGIDYFLLQLDRMMFRSSGQRNVCTFVVTLQERLDHDDLERHLSVNSAYQWICRLRLCKGPPFTLSKWTVDEDAKLPEINQFPIEENEGVPESLLATALEIETQSPFKIDLLQIAGGGSMLVFTWHHALMDAHGGELFIHQLGVLPASGQRVWINPEPAGMPFIERLKIVREIILFLYETSGLPLLSLVRKNISNTTLRYRVMSFTEKQSRIISERAQQHGAGFMDSVFYLAATACAVAHIEQQRVPQDGDVLVPVPQDRRKRGANGSILGNQVTFLFYRIPKAALSSIQNCTEVLIEQMKSLMRTNNPAHFLIMMDFLRHIPGPLYRLLLKSPSAGKMGSFFYSDTGDSLKDYDELFGQTVTGAIHYPPNVYPPGMTFVFTRFRGALQLTFGYMEQVIDDEEVEQLFSQLHFALLGEVVD